MTRIVLLPQPWPDSLEIGFTSTFLPLSRTLTHPSAHRQTHTHAHKDSSIDSHSQTHSYAHTYRHTPICLNTHVHTRTHTHVHILAFTATHTHSHPSTIHTLANPHRQPKIQRPKDTSTIECKIS